MVIFIYSRKSKWTGRGESVENQLAMCRDYIQHNIEGAGEAEIVTYEDMYNRILIQFVPLKSV